MDKLYPDIFRHINTFLDDRSFVNCLLTSKRFHVYTRDHYFSRKYRDNNIKQLAEIGDLEGIKWLHQNRPEACSQGAMDQAAAYGHLEIVTWLHYHRFECCSKHTMDQIATIDYLENEKIDPDIGKWFRFEDCTQNAMDGAASNGHLEIVRWLHCHRSEGCTYEAMNGAAANGHLKIVKWLYQNKLFKISMTGVAQENIDIARNISMRNGHLDIADWLYQTRFRKFNRWLRQKVRMRSSTTSRTQTNCKIKADPPKYNDYNHIYKHNDSYYDRYNSILYKDKYNKKIKDDMSNESGLGFPFYDSINYFDKNSINYFDKKCILNQKNKDDMYGRRHVWELP